MGRDQVYAGDTAGKIGMRRGEHGGKESLLKRGEEIWCASPRALRTLAPRSIGKASWLTTMCSRTGAQSRCDYFFLIPEWWNCSDYSNIAKPDMVNAGHDMIDARIGCPAHPKMRGWRPPSSPQECRNAAGSSCEGGMKGAIESLQKWGDIVKGNVPEVSGVRAHRGRDRQAPAGPHRGCMCHGATIRIHSCCGGGGGHGE